MEKRAIKSSPGASSSWVRVDAPLDRKKAGRVRTDEDRKAHRISLERPLCLQERGFQSAAILAGGMSRRMAGTDKQFLRVGEETLAERVIRHVGSVFQDLVIVTNRPEAYGGSSFRPLRAVKDILSGQGPLSGLHAALCAAKGGWVYLAACDTPGFSADWARLLMEKVEESERSGKAPLACVASCGEHIEPFHALYSKALLPLIENALRDGQRGHRTPSISRLLDGRPHIRVPEPEVRKLSEDWGLFFNINTPADWDAYLRYGSGTDRTDLNEYADARINPHVLQTSLLRP